MTDEMEQVSSELHGVGSAAGRHDDDDEDEDGGSSDSVSEHSEQLMTRDDTSDKSPGQSVAATFISSTDGIPAVFVG